MPKGISALTAAVLLIAFVAATSLTLSGWLSSFVGNLTASVSSMSAEPIACANAAIKIEKVYLTGSIAKMLVRNTGFTSLLVSGTIIDKEGNSLSLIHI